MTVTLPKSVAVIGAGPCGAGFANALLKENHFDKIQLFEKRPDFGGLWNYTGHEDGGEHTADLLAIPCENPSLEIIPLHTKDNKYIWKSPVYDTLDTNVPKNVMSYAHFDFPEELPLFPHREDVRKYMVAYAEQLRSITKFETQIVDVRRDDSDSSWVVTSRAIAPETNGGTTASDILEFADKVENFDAVVLATGNYELPYIPDRPGLSEWNKKFPTSITNAKNYRNIDQFRSSKGKILVIGNSASANDIAYQLATGLGETLFKLARSENLMPAGSSPLIKMVSDVARFDPETKTVHLVDGTALEGIEKVIFATGYLHSFPFFKTAPEQPILTNGDRIYGIYKHVLLYNYPNLAIAGAARYILPTRTAEIQGAWVAKLWSGKLAYPAKEELVKWEEDRIKTKPKKFHDLFFPEDVHYNNELNADIISAGSGGLPTYTWDRELISVRGAVREVKEAYIAYKADTGKFASSFEELINSGHLKRYILTDEEMKDYGF